MTPRKESLRKKYVFYATTVLLMMLCGEVVLHIFIFAWKKDFLWNIVPSEFNVRRFTKEVYDPRYVTNLPNYNDPAYREEGAAWDVVTDEYGFRKGSYEPSRNGTNIVFLGDSVPFGWALPSESSIPSQFNELLKQSGIFMGIINAAIPSYSLDQAVQRFKYEVSGKFKVDSVILQAYDPASQFAILGREWTTAANWTTHTIMNTLSPLEKKIMRWSALYNAFTKVLKRGRYGLHRENLQPDDPVAASHFIASISDSLETLNEFVGPETRIVLVTVGIPKASRKQFSPQRLFAVDLMTKILREFADRHSPHVIFVDTNEIFEKEPDEKVYLDSCCHLSSFGARLEAEALIQKMNPGSTHDRTHQSQR